MSFQTVKYNLSFCHETVVILKTFFAEQNEKREKKKKKERVSKQKLLKSCHQGQNVTDLAVLEGLELKNFSSRPTSGWQSDNTFQCYMAPPLWNSFRRPWSRFKPAKIGRFWNFLELRFIHHPLFKIPYRIYYGNKAYHSDGSVQKLASYTKKSWWPIKITEASSFSNTTIHMPWTNRT